MRDCGDCVIPLPNPISQLQKLDTVYSTVVLSTIGQRSINPRILDVPATTVYLHSQSSTESPFDEVLFLVGGRLNKRLLEIRENQTDRYRYP